MTLSPENILLVGSVMLFTGLLMSKIGGRYGLPLLLLFLFVGMGMGVDGLGYHFDNPATAQFIGMMALSVILFSGGMETKFSDIRPIILPGVVLSTLGVVLTAAITGYFIYQVSRCLDYPFTLPESLLLASVMASTDSASVFSLLRSKGLLLSQNLRPVLELESGSNDPMAYILTIVLIEYINVGELNWSVALNFFMQIFVGSLMGYLMGRINLWFLKVLNFGSMSLNSVLLVACVCFTFSATDRLGGNGYLAVYITGLILGNSPVYHKRNMIIFFEAFTWLWQIVMFLTLGLLVNPKELIPISGLGMAVGLFMIFVSRPISVFACLLPFRRFTRGARLYVSWVGLRGAVPIIFATYPLIAGIPHARMMFNVVFFITILSLVVQGMTVSSMAKIFGVAVSDTSKPRNFDIELPEEIKAAMSEVDITAATLAKGSTLGQLNLPQKTLVIMLRRGDEYFIPRGHTELRVGDKLLVISDDDSNSVKDACDKLGAQYYSIGRNV